MSSTPRPEDQPTPGEAAQQPTPQFGQPSYPGPAQLGPDGRPLQVGYGPDGHPLPPGGYPPAAGGAWGRPPTAPAPQRGGTLKRILTSVGIALVVITVSILWRTGVFDTPSMKVGDCVQQVGTDDVKVVGCGSAEAHFKVLGIKEKQSQMAGRLGACDDWPDATTSYWQGRQSGTGTLYCLAQV